MHMEAKRPVRWWRVWAIVSFVWAFPMVCLGLLHMQWPKVEDLRAERVTGYCTIRPFGKEIVLTQIYSEPKIRELAGDPEAFARLVNEAGKNDGSLASPELMKVALSYRDRTSSNEDRSEQIRKWTPWLQRCVKKMDVDYKAVRWREALLNFSPPIKNVIGLPLALFLVTLVLWMRQVLSERP